MALIVRTSDEVKNAAADAVGALFDSGTLNIRSGTIPANGETAPGDGVILCAITLPADAFGAAAAGTIAKLGTWSGTGAAAAGGGTDATYAELVQGSNVVYLNARGAGDADNGEALVLDNKNIAENQTVTINTFTWSPSEDA